MKRIRPKFVFCLAAGGATGLPVSTALAHGTSTATSSGAMALLIFPAAAILFGLFLVFTHRRMGWTVLVTGGAGHVGSALVPKLLKRRHRVIVLDRYANGDAVFKAYRAHENLREVKADFEDRPALEKALDGCDAVIHLAEITELASLVRAAKAAAVKRFICASKPPDEKRTPGFVTCTVRTAAGHRRDDIADLYLRLLNQPDAKIDGKTYDAANGDILSK